MRLFLSSTLIVAACAFGIAQGPTSSTGSVRLTGSDKVRQAIEGGTLPAPLEEWDREAATFSERRRPFLLHE